MRSNEPARSWHGHRGGVGRPVSATGRAVVLIGFRGESTGSGDPAARAMVRRETGIAIEKIEVRIRGELRVPSNASEPYEQASRQQIDSQREQRTYSDSFGPPVPTGTGCVQAV